ncbi:NAD(+) synthase [Pectinatus frisingensis]|uniref:NAD(+) synthase n=1 Tax=Pectinatus frisingensis TaxID=865 RepID=UPI0015F6914E|nr:NAD(+) synthase [Pectinatus frisingensis]
MIKICSCQFEVEAGHPSKNLAKMLQFINTAKTAGADIIVFPEMAVPGYFLGDTWDSSAFLRDCEMCGKQIIAAADGIVVIFGNVAIDWRKKNRDGRVRKYNALFAAQNKKLIKAEKALYPFTIKTLHPNYREFDDTRYFFSNLMLATEIQQNPRELIQPLRLKIKEEDLCIGCILCEDGWSDDYSLSPIDILCSKNKLDVIFNISASPYTLGKNNKRHRVFSRQAQKNDVPIVYVNNIGIQNNGKTIYTFDGASTVYDAAGIVVSYIEPYSEENSYIDLSQLKDKRYPSVDDGETDDTACVYKALSYGIKKFLQQIHMQKVVIGISGGIDSAVAAALYVAILGNENVLLVNMPSVYNSATTKNLSERLAANLNCAYAVIPIQKVIDYTINQFESAKLINVSGNMTKTIKVSSFVAENIQARDRSARILAGIAAAIGGGFTCNANKAEMTVGYSTLYGDQSGFLAALADLWKYQIYDLARYLNEKIYKKTVIPQAVIDIVPSAELSSSQNVDEGRGDPIKYPYHDFLFRAFVERWDKATPENILDWYRNGTLEQNIGCAVGLVKKYFSSDEEFIADLERWWNLFTGMAVAKRIQAPPILAVSRRAYGFDQREAQNGPYYTKRYQEIKYELLKNDIVKTV